MLQRRFFISLLSLALLAACKEVHTEPTPTVQIRSFSAQPTRVERGQPVTFSWRVAAEGVELECTLDAGDGTPEYTVTCPTGSQTHSYTQTGTLRPVLTVADGAGREQTRAAEVTVEPGGDALLGSFTKLTWHPIADAPIDRHEAFGGFAADGKLYLFGGYSDIARRRFKPTTQVDVYDPETDTWAQRSELPEGISHAGVAVDGEDIYFAGGYPEASTSFGQTFSTDKVWKYNIVTDAYTSFPDLPEAYGGGALALVNNTLHFYGGSDSDRRDSNDHWKLPLDGSGEWTPAARLPTPRNHLGSAVLHGKIYAVGGQSGQDEGAVYRDDVHVYDPQTDSWEAVASLPVALSHNNGSTFSMHGRIIVLGGEPAYLKAVDLAFAYDPETNTWQELTSMPMAKNAGVGGHLDGALYHVTGSTSEDAFKGVPIP